MSRTRTILIMLALSAQMAVGARASTLISPEDLQSKNVVNYKLTEVKRESFVRMGQAGATVFYVDNTVLRFDNDGARFKQMMVRKDAEVRKNDVLATFDVRRSMAALEELHIVRQRVSEAQRDAKTDMDEAIEDAKRAILDAPDAYEREMRRIDLERLLLQWEKSEAQVAYEQALRAESIAKMEEDMNYTELIAPSDAVVRSVALFNAGDSVSSWDPIVVLYAKDKVLLAVEDENGNFRFNMKVKVESGGRNDIKTYTGTVVAADNVLPAKLRSGMAYIALDQEVDAETLRFLQVHYELIRLDNVLTVSRRALTMERGTPFASVLQDDLIRKRFVSPGPHNGDVQWVIDGLEEGQQVILN